MAAFDVIDAAMQGYRQVWAERRYLMRLALVPVLIKFVCTVTVLSLGAEQNFLRQAFLFLPDYFTEGWLLAHVVRLQFLGQRWPFRPTGDNAADEIVLRERFRGVMAGTILYVLSRFLFAGMLYVADIAQAAATIPPGATELPPGATGAVVTMTVLFVGFLWGFRLMWIFIPAALNVPVRDFLRALGRGFMPSIYMIGAWLICFVPVMFAFRLAGSFIVGLAGGEMSAGLQFILTFGQAIVETASIIMSTIAIGWGVAQMAAPQVEKKRPDGR
jgi:hypothetical protein